MGRCGQDRAPDCNNNEGGSRKRGKFAVRRATARRVFLSGAGFLAVALLLAPQAAMASTEHEPARADLNVPDRQSGPVRASQPTLPAASGKKAVYPRLSLPGCSGQDGYNGWIQWNNPYGVQTWGEVWDVCGTTASTWLSWSDPTGHNSNVGQASPYTTNGVNFSYTGMLQAGNISVTVCAWWQGKWRCGTPVHV